MSIAVNFVVKTPTECSSLSYRRGVLPAKLLSRKSRYISTSCLDHGNEDFDFNIFLSDNLNEKNVECIENLFEKETRVVLDICSDLDKDLLEHLKSYVDVFVYDNCSLPKDKVFHTENKIDLNYVGYVPIFKAPSETEINSYVKRLDNLNTQLNMLWFGSYEEKDLLKNIKKTPVEYHKNILYMCTEKSYNSKWSKKWPLEEPDFPKKVLEDNEIDLIVLPKNGVWSRAIDAIYSGVFTIIEEDEYGSNEEFKDFAFVGNVNEGIEYFKNTPKNIILEKVKNGIEYIREDYSEEHAFEDYKKVFSI